MNWLLETRTIYVSRSRYILDRYGKKFILETDHKALINIMHTKLNNNRIYRWALLIQQYDMEIRYKKGKDMIIADVLSRKDGQNKKQYIFINLITLNKKGLFSREKLLLIQANASFENIKNTLQQEGTYKGYSMKNNLLVKQIRNNEVYVTTEEHAKEIANFLHNYYLHIGARKIWLLFREAFYCVQDERIIKRDKEM